LLGNDACSSDLHPQDANFANDKYCWTGRLAEATKSGSTSGRAQCFQQSQPCFWPSRFVTVFVYLNDVEKGGRTIFGNLHRARDFYSYLASSGFGAIANHTRKATASPKTLAVVPKAGMAVIHFPTSTTQFHCLPDLNALHKGEEAISPKHIAQQFIWSVPIAPDDAGVQKEVRETWQTALRQAEGKNDVMELSKDGVGQGSQAQGPLTEDDGNCTLQ